MGTLVVASFFHPAGEGLSEPRNMAMPEASDSQLPGIPGAPEVGPHGVTHSTIWLQWKVPSSGGAVDRYDLEIVNRPLTKTVPCKTNMVEVHDLKHSQSYNFKVRAVNGGYERMVGGETGLHRLQAREGHL